MSQLAENKQNEPVLIENFEPTHCARKSAQKVEVQERGRRLCADETACPPWRAQKVERGSPVSGTKKTGRAEALPVSFISFLQPDFSFSDGAQQGSTAWWLRAFWPSSVISLPCSRFLQFWCVQMVSLLKNLQPDFTFSDGRLPLSTAWWLRAFLPSSEFSLPCSCFLRFFWSALVLGRRSTVCSLIANPGRRIEVLLCLCNSDTCAAATVRAGDGTGALGVELINAGMNRSTEIEDAALEHGLRLHGRGLFEDDLPRAVASQADARAAVIVGESAAVECAGALPAVEENGGVFAEQRSLKLGPSAAVDFVARRADYSHNRAAVEDLSVRRDVGVFGGHELVHSGAVVFQPRRIPGFAKLFQFLTQRRVIHRSSCTYNPRISSEDYRSKFERAQAKAAGLKAPALHSNLRRSRDGNGEERKRRPGLLGRPSLERGYALKNSFGLGLEDNLAEQSGGVVVGTRRKEKTVGSAIYSYHSEAKRDSPDLVDVDRVAGSGIR
jgi:hypothetical protein